LERGGSGGHFGGGDWRGDRRRECGRGLSREKEGVCGTTGGGFPCGKRGLAEGGGRRMRGAVGGGSGGRWGLITRVSGQGG